VPFLGLLVTSVRWLPAAMSLCSFGDADLGCRYVVAVTVCGLVGWARDRRGQDDGRLDLRCLRTSGST
jgi:hypothetical protein